MKFGDLFLDNLKYKKRRSKTLGNYISILGFKTDSKVKVVEPFSTSRVYFFVFLVVFVFFVISLRLFYLQIIKGAEYLEIARNNTLKVKYLPAERGVVFDKNGEVIARNRPGFRIGVFFDKGKHNFLDETYQSLSTILDLDKDFIKNQVDNALKNGFVTVYLKTVYQKEDVLSLDTEEFRNVGVFIEPVPVRDNLFPFETAHILGYLGELDKNGDKVGKMGLEKTYENYLAGKNGLTTYKVNSAGQNLTELSKTEPVAGDSLFLNLDITLQKEIYNILYKNKKIGAVVVQNVSDGGILALVNYPSFNVNLFNSFIKVSEYQELLNDPLNPFFNRAIAGQYPPGSTFKVVTATAGIAEGTVDPYKIIKVPGVISIGDYTYRDWKVDGHGLIDMIGALTVSSDVYFYAVGGGYPPFGIKGLGIEKIHKWATSYGFGSLLGIDIEGEEGGLMPTPEWKIKTYNDKWYLGDDYITAIGQGFILVTPLQLNSMIATVANGGKLYKPLLAKKVEYLDEQGAKKEIEIKSEVKRQDFIPDEALKVVKEGMAGACKPGGTAYPIMGFTPQVACKTGTSEYGIKDSFGKYQTHAWLTLFAPLESPKIALTVFLEGGGEGSGDASRYAREILEWMKENNII